MSAKDSNPHGLKIIIDGVDATDLLRPPSDFFQAAYPDKTPTITVSAAQMQEIAKANKAARREDGVFDRQYFRDEIKKTLSKGDMAFLDQNGTARLVIAEL